MPRGSVWALGVPRVPSAASTAQQAAKQSASKASRSPWWSVAVVVDDSVVGSKCVAAAAADLHKRPTNRVSGVVFVGEAAGTGSAASPTAVSIVLGAVGTGSAASPTAPSYLVVVDGDDVFLHFEGISSARSFVVVDSSVVGSKCVSAAAADLHKRPANRVSGVVLNSSVTESKCVSAAAADLHKRSAD